MNRDEQMEIRSVALGKELEISLESNPGSGVLWSYKPPQAPNGIESLGETRTPLDEAVGSCVRQSFKFKFSIPGTFELHFEFKRPWEKEVRGTKIVEVVVQ